MNRKVSFKILVYLFSFASLFLIAKEKKSYSQIADTSLKPAVLKHAEREVQLDLLSEKRVNQVKKILRNRNLQEYYDQANMILGRHYLRKSVYKQALRFFRKIKEQPLKGQADLESARIYYNLNKYSQAIQLLEQMEKQKKTQSLQLLTDLYYLKRQILLQSKPIDYVNLLEVYCQLLELSNNDKESPYRKQIHRILFTMKEKDLLNITGEDFIKPVKDIVFFQAGKILFYREKFNRSYSFFRKSLRTSMSSFLEKKILKYIRAIESRKTVNREHIGAILPLTGPSSRIGKRILLGIQMGLGFYSQQNSPFQLIVLDSQGHPDKARKAVEDLVTQHHVIGVVGGVLSQTAQAIAEEAQHFGLPAVLMSHKSNITKNKPYAFQNALTSKIVSDQLIQFLMDRFGVKRFALLYPNDPYGVDYANVFWTAVERRGGTITGAQVYQSGETNFDEPIRRLVGTYYLKDRVKEYKERLKDWYKKNHTSKKTHIDVTEVLPPIVNFDALFIPDSAKVLNLIAPYVVFNDIEDIYLIGTTLWNRKNIIKKQSNYINKAFFVDTSLSKDSFKMTKFYKQFVSTFNQSPGLFEVQAYEAALAFRQAIAMGATNRNKLRNTLIQLKNFPGPVGPITITREREFNRTLAVFKIENKQILPFSKDLLNITQLDL